MADDVKYEERTVRVVRGMEARNIEKYKKDGWEVLAQDRGKLRTKITFRRPKPKTPWRLIAALSGVVVIALVIAGVTGAFNESRSEAGESATPSAGASTSTNEFSASEDEPTAAETATANPSEESATSETVDEPVLTAENNEDLAALLAGSASGPGVEEFATTYEDQLIEFDASIGAMAPHGNYDTRYDILVTAGDYSETEGSGPNFQFRDVNTINDLHYVDTVGNRPDNIGVGDELRVVARVGTFDPDNLLFQLEPVSTEFR